MSITTIPLVATYHRVAEASTRSDAGQILDQVRQIRASSSEDAAAHSSALDAAFREVFVELIASLDIESDDFSRVWSLLDSINLLCDSECCESALGFWLIEDLLDSQTINGCRHAFNYLETRRERMTKINFGAKHLTILRCCNELLRRLSRAEDTVFCGRVFIYLFQCFPLGDKSSVNLRGEFHVENVTTYDDDLPVQRENGDGAMELDGHEEDAAVGQRVSQEKVHLDALYPTFWAMQSLFSSPTRLFDAEAMQQFKHGIKQTLACFNKVATDSVPSAVHDPEKRGVKRKHGQVNGERAELNASTFNPKYLTNRDLFDLEIHDIEFRRHILVQALILLDFLLSLSVPAKAKLSTILKNKSTMSSLYDKFTLADDDKAWATETRKTIEKYLEDGNGTEGRYYLRMVNMVLSRDKNWTFWKAEGCPPISQPPVESTVDQKSQEALERVSKAAVMPLSRPKGSLQLDFLSHSESVDALKHKKPQIPTLADYHKGIQTDELDLDFATDAEKQEIEERMAGRLWRALRSARGKRFALCEEIKNGENPDALIGRAKRKADNEDDEGKELPHPEPNVGTADPDAGAASPGTQET